MPGYVRQDRSQMLLKPSKLLGVGFKGDHGTSIGGAKFHNLEREVELVHACQLVDPLQQGAEAGFGCAQGF